MNSGQEQKSKAQAESLGAIVSHSLRRRLWDAITERPISPRELADELGEPVNDVAYHVRKLRDMGIIEPAGTRPVRGATQHFYRAVRRPQLTNEEVENLTLEESSANATNILQLEFADASASLEAGKLVDRPEHFIFRLAVSLDEAGWQEYHSILSEAADRIYEAEARCVDRRRENGEESDPVPVAVHLNLFERG
jgi:biotin operon repressor